MITLDRTYAAAERALDQALARATEARDRLDTVRAGRPVRELRAVGTLAAETRRGIQADDARALAAQANQSARRIASLLG